MYEILLFRPAFPEHMKSRMNVPKRTLNRPRSHKNVLSSLNFGYLPTKLCELLRPNNTAF